jgi:hypothetical protein
VYNVQVTDASGASTCGLVYPNSQYCTVRPAAYLGGALGDYSNTGFKRDGGNFPNGPTAYFAPPTVVGGVPTAPGVSRNSYWGPRYSSVDLTLGKAFGLPHLPVLGENAKARYSCQLLQHLQSNQLQAILQWQQPDGQYANHRHPER